MPEADRCSLNIPFPSWARDNPNTPELDYQNWLEVMRWADRYHREQCGGGSTLPTIDMGDAAVLTGWSKPWYFPTETTLSVITGVLTVADPSITIEAIVAKDAVQIGTATILAGETIYSTDGPWTFEAGTLWQMNVTTGSADAAALTWFGEV